MGWTKRPTNGRNAGEKSVRFLRILFLFQRIYFKYDPAAVCAPGSANTANIFKGENQNEDSF